MTANSDGRLVTLNNEQTNKKRRVRYTTSCGAFISEHPRACIWGSETHIHHLKRKKKNETNRSKDQYTSMGFSHAHHSRTVIIMDISLD